MDPIEIMIRIIVSKDGDVTMTQMAPLADRPLDEVPNQVSLGSKVVAVLECHRWAIKIGRKQAATCHGCTIQCHMKGRYDGKPMEIFG